MTTRADEHAAPPEAWDAIAEGYDRHVAPTEADLAAEALDLAGLRPGERFLDVAAGTGGLALPAARRGAEVLATDWSPAMIERFAARARGEGLRDAPSSCPMTPSTSSARSSGSCSCPTSRAPCARWSGWPGPAAASS